jgi:hypothetical protein
MSAERLVVNGRSDYVGRKRLPIGALILTLCALAGALLACDVTVPVAEDTPTPCPANCPPPASISAAGHVLKLKGIEFTYFDPWSVDTADSNATSATLVAQSQLGQVSVLIATVQAPAGTTSDQLLSQIVQNNINGGQFSDAQDEGPIHGAEIGYVPGSGEEYAAVVTQGNGPTEPVYLDFMAAISGSTGVVFAAVSPLDPNSPDPSVVPNQDYDHMTNSVVWQ